MKKAVNEKKPQKNGIICLETEWELTTQGNRRDLYSKPLLEFFEKAKEDCKVWYRQVATEAELKYYLKKFGQAPYNANDYPIFYFSFHGEEGCIILEGEGRKPSAKVDLLQLAEWGKEYGSFKDKVVHFSSCETLKGVKRNIKKIDEFKRITKAKVVSGYAKSVPTLESAINDIAFFNQVLQYKSKKAWVTVSMDNLMGGLGDMLKFTVF